MRDSAAQELTRRFEKPLAVAFSDTRRAVCGLRDKGVGPLRNRGSVLSGREWEWSASTNGGVQPRFRADGKEIYFMAPEGRLMAGLVTVSGSTFAAAAPTALFITRLARQRRQPAAIRRFRVTAASCSTSRRRDPRMRRSPFF